LAALRSSVDNLGIAKPAWNPDTELRGEQDDLAHRAHLGALRADGYRGERDMEVGNAGPRLRKVDRVGRRLPTAAQDIILPHIFFLRPRN
jgi:hypothetical protein